jgi:D-3-phosphoglycerate dehydrogenase
MKDGVYIVNTARGGVINEVTLIDFIESGKVAGAALDVLKTNPARTSFIDESCIVTFSS